MLFLYCLKHHPGYLLKMKVFILIHNVFQGSYKSMQHYILSGNPNYCMKCVVCCYCTLSACAVQNHNYYTCSLITCCISGHKSLIASVAKSSILALLWLYYHHKCEINFASIKFCAAYSYCIIFYMTLTSHWTN